MAINHLQTYFCLWLGTKISFLIYSLFVPNWSQSRKNIFQCYATLWILIFMEKNTLLHSSQLSIAVINITLYYNDYGPAYTDTVGWLSVATNTMTHRLRTSSSLQSEESLIKWIPGLINFSVVHFVLKHIPCLTFKICDWIGADFS